ncbi:MULTISPECIES: helix-turn-helix domain-containing protein [unclassified Enterobacter]|uniref:helix-turn-helix domain-containing protein n=1 Tax=unclassified Enterobacter TaxID=2608935 RepID=UPI0008E68843|nr:MULTISPECIES: LuxR C-terminal-related transcriptional regulator [unclassified Enterobacter]SFR13487.1 DNA-binding response regulator, NarL/FixJ family, contains REC and HTH domains [Enterobacter sp. kpr-6]
MDTGSFKYGVVISKAPIMQQGLGSIMERYFPDYEMTHCSALEELTLLQLRRANLVIADMSIDMQQPQSVCEHYYKLMSQYKEIHWVFIVPRSLYTLAVQLLLRPESTILSNVESLDGIINAIRAGSQNAENISHTLLSPDFTHFDVDENKSQILTLSERKVLRLIGKGWGINQVAMLLKKSNKTVSAQKNSAMRRLSLRSNAEMYAWINSSQGMRELNLSSAYGEQAEWKKVTPNDMLLSSKIAL